MSSTMTVSEKNNHGEVAVERGTSQRYKSGFKSGAAVVLQNFVDRTPAYTRFGLVKAHHALTAVCFVTVILIAVFEMNQLPQVIPPPSSWPRAALPPQLIQPPLTPTR